MMRSLYLKTLYDKRWFVLGWTLGLGALSALLTSFYPAMHQDGSLDALVANMPKAFEGLVGSLANLKTLDLYTASQLFDIRLPLIAGIMAIILGNGLGVAEEATGELRTLVSLPISRTKLLFHKWLAMLTIMAVTLLGLVAGVYAVLPFLSDATLDATVLRDLLLMTFLLMSVYGTISFGVGMATGNKGLAMMISILVIIGSFILTTFGQAVDWLADYEKISLLHYFPAVDIAKDGIGWQNVVVLTSLTLVVLLVSILLFRRRDIG